MSKKQKKKLVKYFKKKEKEESAYPFRKTVCLHRYYYYYYHRITYYSQFTTWLLLLPPFLSLLLLLLLLLLHYHYYTTTTLPLLLLVHNYYPTTTLDHLSSLYILSYSGLRPSDFLMFLTQSVKISPKTEEIRSGSGITATAMMKRGQLEDRPTATVQRDYGIREGRSTIHKMNFWESTLRRFWTIQGKRTGAYEGLSEILMKKRGRQERSGGRGRGGRREADKLREIWVKVMEPLKKGREAKNIR